MSHLRPTHREIRVFPVCLTFCSDDCAPEASVLNTKSSTVSGWRSAYLPRLSGSVAVGFDRGFRFALKWLNSECPSLESAPATRQLATSSQAGFMLVCMVSE